ncbi:MAG: glycosyltransferase [Candidatus Aminicenantes bacterium]|nr:glycosyltransferase [Candidatus Aminicenantes bacterium]MDH5383838.1 glycosyltransferase [Candidatus Aminicenantes bacterium]MDH5743285.1 glycosyltransferase [Candidatus Aminicenantes bacterium]
MISVIVPTFNRASFLLETIHSVFDQDCFQNPTSAPPFELLVIDDGSTDNTEEAVKSLGKEIKYFFQGHRGVSAARNQGIKLSSGDFIAFLDSDDLWLKNKITAQMSFMQAYPKAMVCYTEESWVRNGVLVNARRKHKKYSGWIFDRVLPLCLLSLSSALFRREVFETVGYFDEELPACEDYDFGIRLAHRFPVHLIDQPLIIKRGGHADQLSKKYWGMDRFRVYALEKALRLDLSSEQKKSVEQELVKKCQILVKGFQKRDKHEEFQKYLSLIAEYKLQEEE